MNLIPISSLRRGIRSYYSSIAFAFDIDGVLLQGRKVIPQAKTALNLLRKKNIPFCILTNGGAMMEEEKATALSQALDCEINGNQVILSHTPMKSLVPKYGEKEILIIGPDTCKAVATKYGFSRITTPSELVEKNPDLWPFIKSHGREHQDLEEIQFSAIMMMHDSPDWGRDMQIMMDALRGVDGKILHEASQQSIPIYFSNSDLLWRAHHNRLRFAQGSFRHCFESLYHRLTGDSLTFTAFGKPTNATFTYANQVLKKLSGRGHFDAVYMVGDNPAADILGANDFGRPWHSMLVKTGVWNADRDGDFHGADFVCENVEEAVLLALER
jgi:HAD superfamily hydrolase (TIGR01456 family)